MTPAEQGQWAIKVCKDCGYEELVRMSGHPEHFRGMDHRVTYVAVVEASRLEAAENALREYGKHLSPCPHRVRTDRPCRCGLEAALHPEGSTDE